MKHVVASMIEWEPGQLQGNEAFDTWWPMTERRRMLLASGPTTTDATPPSTSVPSTYPETQSLSPPIPAGVSSGDEHSSGGENAPEEPDHPWFTGLPEELHEGSPSDYWSLI
jgi:hypothetical protein